MSKVDETRTREAIRQVQSQCNHSRMGIMKKKKDRYLYCLDCLKQFPGKEIKP